MLQILVRNNIITDAEARYMDDIRLFLWLIRMGWRWTGQELEYCKEWREEDRMKGLTPIQKTTEVLSAMMNSICSFLTLTMETADDFQDRRLPTLDLNIWIGESNMILFVFSEKSIASNQTIQKRSAMPENGRMATLNQELVRRLLNTSEELNMGERVVVVDTYCQKLTDSGYQHDQVKRVIVGGLTGYERRRGLSLLDPSHKKFRPLHESRKYNARGRRIAKLMSKQNWYKRKPDDSPGSPTKRMELSQKDGNLDDIVNKRLQSEHDSPGSPIKRMKLSQKDGNLDEIVDKRLESEHIDLTQGQGTNIYISKVKQKSYKEIQMDTKKINKKQNKIKKE